MYYKGAVNQGKNGVYTIYSPALTIFYKNSNNYSHLQSLSLTNAKITKTLAFRCNKCYLFPLYSTFQMSSDT